MKARRNREPFVLECIDYLFVTSVIGDLGRPVLQDRGLN